MLCKYAKGSGCNFFLSRKPYLRNACYSVSQVE
uniref:Uncharacterized protein n=1 Tax=Anguilla anguilla TaxID=7936 RepID=A0A0E9PRN2_ANGAN